MKDLFKGFFKRETSSQTAKDRLRLVLMSDHLALAPETIAAMKAELLAVIARYVEFDPAHADVSFESRESDVAMLASIPILSVRERPPTRPPGGGGTLSSGGGNAATPPHDRPRAASTTAVALEAPPASATDLATRVVNAETAPEGAAVAATAAVTAADAPKPRTSRRRRRRKARVMIAPLPT